MTTDRQAESNRINGQKSHGATTPEGLEKIARANLVHGMLAKTIVLDGESPENFEALLQANQDQFNPVGPAETALVEMLTVARWSQMRIWAAQGIAVNSEIRQQTDNPSDPQAATRDSSLRASNAFLSLNTRSRALDMFDRAAGRYERQYIRALNQLIRLRDKRSEEKNFLATPSLQPE
jgi:hypothetical protein